MFTRFLRNIVKLKRKMRGHCDGDGKGGTGSGHCS